MRQDRKRIRLETSHKLCREAGRRAECWKSACSVRRGGGWKRVYGSVSEALPEETGSKRLGWTFGTPRQSSTLQAEPGTMAEGPNEKERLVGRESQGRQAAEHPDAIGLFDCADG